MVTITDFAVLDFRVGKIVEIEDLETARKPMYKLKVDLGELGLRSIAAGLKTHYSKEQLLNTLVVVVANLEPKNIANFMSEGMVLAAEDGENIVLIRPEKDLAPGSKIR